MHVPSRRSSDYGASGLIDLRDYSPTRPTQEPLDFVPQPNYVDWSSAPRTAHRWSGQARRAALADQRRCVRRDTLRYCTLHAVGLEEQIGDTKAALRRPNRRHLLVPRRPQDLAIAV